VTVEDQRDEFEQRMWPFPSTLILGMSRNEWPVQAFTNEAHALVWIGQDPVVRRLRRVRVETIEELEFVPPSSPELKSRS
jgi:hypothetical protein